MSVDLFQKVISDPKFDPYDVFRLPHNFTLKQLTKQYHKKALRYHPDKGGDALKYNIIKYAYRLLCDEHEKRECKVNDFQTLKQQSQENFTQTHDSTTIRRIPIQQSGTNFNLQRFNQNFQSNKIDFDRDAGYDDWMNQTPESSEAIDAPPSSMKGDKEAFNSQYLNRRNSRKKKQKKKENSIQVYKEPKPSYTTKLKFSEVDLSRPDTFNQNTMNPDIHFRDYKDAYTDSEITNVQVEERPQFDTIDALQKHRSSISRTMTESDRMKYTARLELEKRQERERQKRIRNQNQRIKKHHDIVSALMLQ